MLGCQGYHAALKHATPNIDALAASGTRFSRTYCTNPICCPSRANMLSGTYTHECESWNNFKGLETGMWTYDKALKHAGYDVLLLGKHGDHLTGHHSVMNRVADMVEPLNERHLPVMNDDGAQAIEVRDDQKRRRDVADWNRTDRAVAFLKDKGHEQSNGKPFFLCVNFGLVHAAFRTNRYWLEQIPEDLIDAPPVDETNHPADVYQRASKAWRHGLDDKTVKLVRRIYFAMCAEADAMVGEMVAALDQAGLSDDTVVIFSSDHGELALEHQQYYKMSHLEGSARVPLIISGPGIQSGQVIETPTSLIDIAPTICDIAGLEPRFNHSGESLLPVAKGENLVQRGWALSTYCGVTTNTMSHMLVKDGYKLIVYEGYPSRLFNLSDDPEELRDLAEVEPEKVSELEALLDEQVDRQDTLARWTDYRKHAFAQFQRQAKRGLYWDHSYSLRGNPSSDYHALMDNAFTGWNEEDESRLNTWLKEGE
jgi:arylsulfatase K